MTFHEGDIVKVKKSGLWSTGKKGTVVKATSKRVDVSFESGFYSKVLTLNPLSLELLFLNPNGDIYENKNNNIKGEKNMLMGNYSKICTIKFIEGTNTNREYYYACYDDNIGLDDYVVVKSANHGFGLAKVVDVIGDADINQMMRDYCNEGREIISKFDMKTYEDRVEKRKKAKQLKADMNKKMKEMQELAMFEMMAKENPELKEMLDAYKELIK